MEKIRRQHGGFTLLEVLISVIVLAVGLLGIAMMQVTMIRNNHAAQLRSIALAQVDNMIDRMRANYAGLKLGYYNTISGTSTNPNCTACTNSQIAQLDNYQWNSDNALLLPAGIGTVSKNGSTFTIIVRWDNNRTGASGLGCSGNTNIDLTCLNVEVQL